MQRERVNEQQSELNGAISSGSFAKQRNHNIYNEFCNISNFIKTPTGLLNVLSEQQKANITHVS